MSRVCGGAEEVLVMVYVSNILNPLVFKLPSFIKDTTHFLDKLSSLDNLPNNSLLVSLDVSSLYTNIPHSEGIQAARNTLTNVPHRDHLQKPYATSSTSSYRTTILSLTDNFSYRNMVLPWALEWLPHMQTYLWGPLNLLP